MALNIERLRKVLTMAGSSADGEALSALRMSQKMLSEAGISFTDIAQSFELPRGTRSAYSVDFEQTIERLQARLNFVSGELERACNEIKKHKAELAEHKKKPSANPDQNQTFYFNPRLIEIEAIMRMVLNDPVLSLQSNAEISQKTRIAPKTISGWRKRLEEENARPKHRPAPLMGDAWKCRIIYIEAILRVVIKHPWFSEMSNRAISKRTGISAEAVAHWRWRMALE